MRLRGAFLSPVQTMGFVPTGAAQVHSAARLLALLAHGAGGCRLLAGGDFNDQPPIAAKAPGARSEGGVDVARNEDYDLTTHVGMKSSVR